MIFNMNETLFLAVLLVSLCSVLFVTRLGKTWLSAIPPIFLILAIIFAANVTPVFGIPISLIAPVYAAIFLATDIVAEHWGKKAARQIVWIGFMAQVILLVISQLVLLGKFFEFSAEIHNALVIIFAFAPRIVLGSLIAYIISQTWDIWIFHLLKEKMSNKHLWLRNNVSTITSQFIDSFLFVTIAFYGILPAIIPYALGLWVLKVLVALIDTPFIYLSYKVLKKPFK
jgi:uncharacterized integral membrane protein (TIGR00697 family)